MLTFIEHEDYYKHKMPNILESPRRLKIIANAMDEAKIFDYPYVSKEAPDLANEEELKVIHSDQLIETVKHGSMLGVTSITGDTITNEHTFQAALRGIGGVKLAADLLTKKKAEVVYTLTRPPGHHATRRNAMGFCFFNNIAFAANYLVTKKKLKRVAIIDIDQHYGNGTADLFYNQSDVLTISLHVDPKISFPFQGRISELGEKEGEGYNICIPLPALTGDQEYLQAFERIVPPIIRDYKPEMILVASGYDALKDDPYGYLGLSIYCFQVVMEQIKNLANEQCNGKMLLTLEGGYKFDELGQAFLASISPMIKGYQFEKEPKNKLNTGGSKNLLKETLNDLRKIMKPYWQIE